MEGGENKRGRQRWVRIVNLLGAESVLCLIEREGEGGRVFGLQCLYTKSTNTDISYLLNLAAKQYSL